MITIDSSAAMVLLNRLNKYGPATVNVIRAVGLFSGLLTHGATCWMKAEGRMPAARSAATARSGTTILVPLGSSFGSRFRFLATQSYNNPEPVSAQQIRIHNISIDRSQAQVTPGLLTSSGGTAWRRGAVWAYSKQNYRLRRAQL